MNDPGPLRLGTRGSRLAVRQTEWVAQRLQTIRPDLRVEIRTIRTTGDRILGTLREVGGKGLFTKEIEEALLAGEIDAGVHSLKDMPAALPEGLVIAAVPGREDPRDALVASTTGGLRGLRKGARIGTGSLRRQALLRHLRADLEVVDLRGNIDTRIGKWRSGALDAVVLALAGLHRLGLDLAEAQPFSADELLPAIGQGALAVEASSTSRWVPILGALSHPPSALAVTAERGFLQAVGGDCKTPIAAHATVSGAEMRLRALIAEPSGLRVVEGERFGRAAEGEAIGRALGEELLARGGREILEAIGV